MRETVLKIQAPKRVECQDPWEERHLMQMDGIRIVNRLRVMLAEDSTGKGRLMVKVGLMTNMRTVGALMRAQMPRRMSKEMGKVEVLRKLMVNGREEGGPRRRARMVRLAARGKCHGGMTRRGEASLGRVQRTVERRRTCLMGDMGRLTRMFRRIPTCLRGYLEGCRPAGNSSIHVTIGDMI